MANAIPIFKSWVPGWMVKVILFLLMIPSLILFFLPLCNIQAAAGYYGCEPADIQFSVAIYYASYVGFYVLERRFFYFLAAKEYFLLITVVNIGTTWACYLSNNLSLLFVLRFLQGMLYAAMVNLSLSLMFTQLRSERAREVSFSVFFCLLLCAVPFNNLITADLVDAYNFNVLYEANAYAFLPGLLLLMVSMNSVRLKERLHLQKLDWPSFVLYSVPLCLFAYLMIYGQEYYWLEDRRIQLSLGFLLGLLFVFVCRQHSLKRPYLDLSIFQSRNLKIGLLLLFVLYIVRFASGIINTYFQAILLFDPIHLSYINVFNLLGIVVGLIVSCSLVLQKKGVRTIWLVGFSLLFAYHVTMYFLFDIQANPSHYMFPLFLQGCGVGLIMVPTIVFIISSVSVSKGPSAAAVGLTVRYLGFCASIGLLNYRELAGKSKHYHTFQEHLSALDLEAVHRLQQVSHALSQKGMSASSSPQASYKMLINTLNRQDQLRFSMDYYEWMSWLLFGTLLLVALFPYLGRTILYLRTRKLAPA